MTKEQLYQKFMNESHAIESEQGNRPGDIDAVKFALAQPLTIERICELHAICGQDIKEYWVGKFRDCNVRVGGHICPDYRDVPKEMEEFFYWFPQMDAWGAHTEFEKIHPFMDLNGRVGRLLWLSKAVKEGYSFQRTFLHQYYYDTLARHSR